MTKHTSFDTDQATLDQLRSEANKEDTSMNQLINKIIKAYLNKSEILPAVTQLDLSIKQEKLEELKLKNAGRIFENSIKESMSIYWKTFGQSPSNKAKAAIESRYENPADYTDQQWIEIFEICVTVTPDNSFFICQSCGDRVQKRETMKTHLKINHQDSLKIALAQVRTVSH